MRGGEEDDDGAGGGGGGGQGMGEDRVAGRESGGKKRDGGEDGRKENGKAVK